MQTIPLNGEWKVTPTLLSLADEAGCREVLARDGEWLTAQVPGEIHLDLMRHGRMADPAVSDHARRCCRWPEEHAWWYRTTFAAPTEFRAHERQWLVFEGIDLSGQIFLNGLLIGTAANSFVAHSFSAKRALRDGLNELVVRVTSGTELVANVDRGAGFGNQPFYANRNFDGRRWLRKPQYSYGWDWVDPLPNIGLWRGVRLEGRSYVIIRDFRVDTVFQDGQVLLVGEAVLENLHPCSERAATLELTLTAPDAETVVQEIPLLLSMGCSVVPLRIVVPDPQLWWPNGMGDQPLYGLTVRVLQGAAECDGLAQTIGLRTITLDRSPLRDGSRFCLKVNDQPVFCRGGNWAPADMIPARIPRERYETLVAEAKHAGFNMFRVNGVGLYEDDAFYDACDRAGILVWQDFMFSCLEYPDYDPRFYTAVQTEAETVVRRLRHHAALALWCGGNENLACTYRKDLPDPDALGGIRIYGQILPEVTHRLDPYRLYWPNSPYGGETANEVKDDQAGDAHWWRLFLNADVSFRLQLDVADKCEAHFVSEYGIIGPPHAASVPEYLLPDERSLEATAWRVHVNLIGMETVTEGIRVHYGEPEGLSLAEVILYGQLVQAMAHGHAMEALRFRKQDRDAECWGALIWSYNDCWGEVGWSVIDHYLRRKASYYWLRRACQPVKIIVRPRGNQLVTRIVNDTLETHQTEVQYGWFRLDGTDRLLTTRPVVLPVNGMVEIARETMPGTVTPHEWVYGAVLQGDRVDDQTVWLPRPIRALHFPEPRFCIARVKNTLEISCPTFCHAVHVNDGGRELLSDNYFDLLPGVPKRVTSTQPIDQAVRAVPSPIGQEGGQMV